MDNSAHIRDQRERPLRRVTEGVKRVSPGAQPPKEAPVSMPGL